MSEKRIPINWGFIEPLWRAGGLSNYEIARQYEAHHARSKDFKRNLTEGAIRDRARRKAWIKDLEPAIAQRTRDKVLRTDLRSRVDGQRLTDDDIVEAAAEARARVIRSIQGTVDRVLALLNALVDEFHADRDQVVVGWWKGEASEHRVKMGSLEKANMGLKISAMVANLAPHLRLAYGLDDKSKGNEARNVEVYLDTAPKEDGDGN